MATGCGAGDQGLRRHGHRGNLAAGDDAAEVRWVSPAELGRLPLTSGLAETLAGWGVLG